MKLTVLTYNICSGHNLKYEAKLDETAAFIRSTGADFVGVNEVDMKNERSGGVDQTAVLSELAGYPYSVFSRSIDFRGGYYGNALLSKFPIVRSKVIPVLSDMEGTGKRGEDRSLLSAVLYDGKREFAVLVTHFGLSVPERSAAVKALLDELKEIGDTMPVFFMGDLNAAPDAPEMAPIFEALADTAAAFDGSRLLTIDSGRLYSKIDYIFTSRNVKTLAVRVPHVTYSDHCPYLAEVEI